MLDVKTRKVIDEARDILVGKIPAPNTQVEQITLALLYKFMDDMDQESIEMGGEPKFFAEDFKKYSWKTIISNKIGAQERFNLYTEALEKFYSQSNLPQTFRDIFKSATVPYKDPEVLTMFLRKLDSGLNYSDSEKLGDAYEHLLMILGSQGDLGQFRTPRHIIDFIVEVLDPQPNEKILDPACGTAGFLISAYKHIIKNNPNMDYDAKLALISKNITGYDIEPSMVRIAEMNLFLHGATDPDIREYDTLTYEDHWEEKFDVILANPPFMTPKGGITPHKKFTIKAKRSEVLFVDYIDEHLKSSGRAGIIVPEGVLFNSATAYKDLRKKIIKKNLVAIVSLPGGVFQPYSGVKTSILFLDKKLAKDNKEVLFIDLKNDGFSLGSQRKPIEGSELTEVATLIKKYKSNELEESDILSVKINLSVITKAEVFKNDSSLNVGRYLKNTLKIEEFETPEVIVDRLTERQKEYETIFQKLVK